MRSPVFGFFWSASAAGTNTWRSLLGGDTEVYRAYDNQRFGFSVRCVRDETKTWPRSGNGAGLFMMHPRKVYLQHLTKGVSFLGSFIRPTHVVPGKRFKGSLHGMIDAVNADAHNAEDPARVEAVRNRLNAYWGLTHGFSAYRLRKKSWRRLDGRWEKKLKPSVGLRKTTMYR